MKNIIPPEEIEKMYNSASLLGEPACSEMRRLIESHENLRELMEGMRVMFDVMADVGACQISKERVNDQEG